MNPVPAPPVPVGIEMPWWFDALTLMPLLIVGLAVIVIWRQNRSGQGYLKKQADYLDHQKDINVRALDQSKTFEDMIAHQYEQANGRTDQALAQSAEALRLHAAALEQLTAMNATLSRLARTIEAGPAGPSAAQ